MEFNMRPQTAEYLMEHPEMAKDYVTLNPKFVKDSVKYLNKVIPADKKQEFAACYNNGTNPDFHFGMGTVIRNHLWDFVRMVYDKPEEFPCGMDDLYGDITEIWLGLVPANKPVLVFAPNWIEKQNEPAEDSTNILKPHGRGQIGRRKTWSR